MKMHLPTVAIVLLTLTATFSQASIPVWAQSPGPTISAVSDNRTVYPNGQIPNFEKLEITFQINTYARNLQWPYDPAPPSGIPAGVGVSVNAIFTSPSGQTFSQPAFYYQEYDDQVKGGREWFYPTGRFFWKVRFAPNQIGNWQYRLTAQDAGGTGQSSTQSFTVVPSANKGFIRVSPRDSRYFEFDDGTYFPGLGYNMNYDHVGWVNPVLDNRANFQTMNQNGIQLVRVWLSQWAIFGSSWNPWYGIRNDYDGYIPRTGLTANALGSETSPTYKLTLVYSEDSTTGAKNSGSWYDACRFIGGFQASPAVKRNTRYRIRIKYWAFDLTGPRNLNYPNYGLVAKVQNPNDANWHTQCYEPQQPANGVVVTAYGRDTASGAYLDGQWDSGARDFLPMFYLTLDNVNGINAATGRKPYAYIESVAIQEDLGNGQYGPNIVSKPTMEQQTYFEQRNSYAFDKLVELARQNGVYLKPVILEKNELIQNGIDYNGLKTNGFDNNNFYGNWRTVTAVRWLQMTWWRYLQARWGYSTSIHSWELMNEGDPWNSRHYAQVDEFGKFMRCTVFGVAAPSGDGQKCTLTQPNRHLITTSFWNSFPNTSFWANANYPNVDYADVHQYIPKDTDPTHFADTALSTFDVSLAYGAKQSGGAGKPVLRGETGLTDSGTEPAASAVVQDTNAVWLHDYIWGGINAGGLLESYWYDQPHVYGSGHDHRTEYGNYFRFIKDVPLSNGSYQNAGANSSNSGLRAWGQKDLVNGQAHLWVQNINHTWQNVVNGVSIPALSGTIAVSGFKPRTPYTLQRWNTDTGTVSSSQTVTSDPQGGLALTISSLTSDVAFKLSSIPVPTFFPQAFLPFLKR